jgi:hypothetical protein
MDLYDIALEITRSLEQVIPTKKDPSHMQSAEAYAVNNDRAKIKLLFL